MKVEPDEVSDVMLMRCLLESFPWSTWSFIYTSSARLLFFYTCIEA